jgi:hypothetical protein
VLRRGGEGKGVLKRGGGGFGVNMLTMSTAVMGMSAYICSISTRRH